MGSLDRNQLLQLAQSSNLKHKSVLHSLKGPHGEDLFTDYFYTEAKSKNTVIHLSGLHGVEGYFGDLVQQDILKLLAKDSQLPFQLVIVHAVNPYGMAWCRRTNAKNVDLNRNSLKIYDIPNSHFERFSPFLDTNADWGSIEALLGVFVGFYTVGPKQMIQSVACGQTDFPMSVFYAGSKLQPELESLKATLLEIVPIENHLVVMDVHTGLGSHGQESLIVDGPDSQDEIQFFEKVFQKKTIVPGKTRGIYQANGTIANLFYDDWNRDHVRYVCEEFGTRAFPVVLKALMKDNYLHHWQPDLTHEEKLKAWSDVSSRMLYAFFPEEQAWRSKCVATGVERFQQLVQNFK